MDTQRWSSVQGYSDTGHPRIVLDGPVYVDTQTWGLVMGGRPRIVRDGLGISGVWRYSDTGVDVQGLSEYTRTQQPGHPRNALLCSRHGSLDLLSLDLQYAALFNQAMSYALSKVGKPGIVHT